jgi:hypothetical protein
MSMNEEHLSALLVHVSIIHHVRGRLRLRLHPGILQWLDNTPERWLAHLPGVSALRLNKAAASLVIDYDAGRLSPEWWERLLVGGEVALLLAEVDLPMPQFSQTH